MVIDETQSTSSACVLKGDNDISGFRRVREKRCGDASVVRRPIELWIDPWFERRDQMCTVLSNAVDEGKISSFEDVREL